MSDKVQLTVSGIQADLNNGLSRANIQEKYGLSNKDLKAVFQHPKLKGLKTKPAPAFELVDDTVEAEAPVETEVVDETMETQEEEDAPVVTDEF